MRVAGGLGVWLVETWYNSYDFLYFKHIFAGLLLNFSIASNVSFYDLFEKLLQQFVVLAYFTLERFDLAAFLQY